MSLFSKILFVALLIITNYCLGQPNLTDSAVYYARAQYFSSIGANSHLLNGVAYKDYNMSLTDIGHAYFVSDDWEYGSVVYDGQEYYKVDMMYDMVRDKIIIDHPYGHFKLQLIDQKVTSFTLQGHKFVRMVKDSVQTLKTGYYDLLYDGSVKVYVKQRKEIQENLSGRTIIKDFLNRPVFYIYKDGVYNVVRSKKAVLSVFKERKSIVRRHLSSLKIRYRKNTPKALVEAAKSFDESGK